jgi:hypothetical protein
VSSSASEPNLPGHGRAAVAVAVAGRVETTPVTFPGGHDGLLGGEYGRTGDPEASATTLHKVLAG